MIREKGERVFVISEGRKGGVRLLTQNGIGLYVSHGEKFAGFAGKLPVTLKLPFELPSNCFSAKGL